MPANARNKAPAGKLMLDPNASENGVRVFLSDPFRFFFSKDSQKSAPAKLDGSGDDGLPDFVAEQLHNLLHAYHVFVHAVGLPDFRRDGIFSEQGVSFIDVTLDDLPVQRGLASAKVQETTPPFLRGSAWDGASLSLRLHRALPAQSLTPAHELFHLFQYASLPFQNIWFMEGLARHAQRWPDNKPLKQIPLPTTRQALESVLGQWHEAEPFWNRLCTLCATSVVLTGSTEDAADGGDELYPANPHLYGQHFLPVYFEEVKRCIEVMRVDMPTRQLGPPAQWGGDERRTASNNRYLLRAIVYTVERLEIDAPHPELEAFLSLLRQLDSYADTVQDEPTVQRLFAALQKYKLATVYHNNEQKLRCDAFDPITATLSIAGLNIGADVENSDLSAFSVVRGLVGNLSVVDCQSISDLVGFNALVSVQGSVTIENTGVRQMNAAFASLARIKGTLRIAGNLQLTEINDFHALESIDNALHIENSPLLKSLNAFDHLTEIKKGPLSLIQAPLLQEVHAFGLLKIAHDICLEHLAVKNLDFLKLLFDFNPIYPGAIRITSCKLQNINSFSKLKSVGSSFYLHGNKLDNLKGLENLQTVGASFSLGSNQLTDISQLANLTKINGILNLSANHLTSLHGLENLRSVKTVEWNNELLTIKFEGNKNSDDAPSLTDISALANLQEINRNIIFYADADHVFSKTPHEDSVFYSNNIKVIEKTATYRVPVLFSKKWQASLKKCSRINAFCEDIMEADKIISFCKKNNIRLIFANTLTLQYLLLNNKDKLLNNGLKFLNNNKSALDCFRDKAVFHDFMMQNNLLEYMPRHFNTVDADELINKPYIIKKKISTNSDGVRIVQVGEKVNALDHNSIVTEYIEGCEEYASNIFFKDGDIVKHITYRKIYADPVYILSPKTRGDMKNERCEPSCMEIFKHILSLANPNGGYCLCCIDYKMVNKVPKIFEINARIGYTLVCYPADFTEMMNIYIEHAYLCNNPDTTPIGVTF